MNDKCPIGAENRANIESLKDALDDFKVEVRTDIKYITICMDKITNHYSKRVSPLITLIISTLASGLVGTVVWIASH